MYWGRWSRVSGGIAFRKTPQVDEHPDYANFVEEPIGLDELLEGLAGQYRSDNDDVFVEYWDIESLHAKSRPVGMQKFLDLNLQTNCRTYFVLEGR